MICADLAAYRRMDASWSHLCYTLLFNPGFHAVLLYRLPAWCAAHHLDWLGAPVGYLAFVLTGAQISRRARIGPGFVVAHPQGVVVGCTTILGTRVTLCGHNTLGQRHGAGDRPTVGDFVTLGAGAHVVGRITIGNYVAIGANAVVLRSVPSYATAVGVPARVIREEPSCRAFTTIDFPAYRRTQSMLGARASGAIHTSLPDR